MTMTQASGPLGSDGRSTAVSFGGAPGWTCVSALVHVCVRVAQALDFKRSVGTHQPFGIVHFDQADGSLLLGALLSGRSARSGAPAVDLLLELPPPGRPLPPFEPAAHLLLFLKLYTAGQGHAPRLAYAGHVVASRRTTIRALLPDMRRLAGLPPGVIVECYEEVPRQPGEPPALEKLPPAELSSPLGEVLRGGAILVLSHQNTQPSAQNFYASATEEARAADRQEQDEWHSPQGSPQRQGEQQQQPGILAAAAAAAVAQLSVQQQGQPETPGQQTSAPPVSQQQSPQPAAGGGGGGGAAAAAGRGAAAPAARPVQHQAASSLLSLLQQAVQEAEALQQREQDAGQQAAELEAARQQVQEQRGRAAALDAELRQLQQRVQQMEGDPQACRELSTVQLEALLALLDASRAALGRLLTERYVEEARAQARAEATDCGICLAAPKDTRLSPCGHLLCRGCSQRLAFCPVCRERVAGRERAFL
ncbi:hypothetical protein ABPG75_004853 [Micractinium tetrahymenae]